MRVRTAHPHAIIRELRSNSLKAWPFLGIFVVQSILILGHLLLFATWTFFWPGLSAGVVAGLRAGLLVMCFTFLPAALLSFRFSGPLLAWFYRIAVLWLGFLNFLVIAAILCWPAWFLARWATADPAAARPWICAVLTGLAVLAGLYGMVNARMLRVRRLKVSIPHLPASWRGRRAVVMSDLHLGNVNGIRFSRRLVRLANSLNPDIVFLPGDVFDGVRGNLDRLLEPFRDLKPPLGVFFSSGNHEEFGDPAPYLEPIARAGIRVLLNERVTVDGVHIAGISYRDSTFPIRVRSLLETMNLNSGMPSILLHHVPSRLQLAERAGVSLQLSGHTHCGQVFPYNLITYRIFGRFTHGLHSFGAMQVYTSSGAGTWGPPMRVGTQPEIVALEFE